MRDGLDEASCQVARLPCRQNFPGASTHPPYSPLRFWRALTDPLMPSNGFQVEKKNWTAVMRLD